MSTHRARLLALLPILTACSAPAQPILDAPVQRPSPRAAGVTDDGDALQLARALGLAQADRGSPLRGLPACPDILTDGQNCHTADLGAGAALSNDLPGAPRVIENFWPLAANPTRICWIGRYTGRAGPAVADESFRIRIFVDTGFGLPDLSAGPVFDRVFSQTGAPGQSLLELDCLDGQTCPGTSSPASGGHYVYSISVDVGLPIPSAQCSWIEISCVGSAAAGRHWAWLASLSGADILSLQAIDGQYTPFSMIANDRALCVTGGVDPFSGLCSPTIPPAICTNAPANGQPHDGITGFGMRSSSSGSIGRPQPPGAWTPLQRAENFQVAAPVSVTSTCFSGFYLGVGCQGSILPPEPTHDIEFYADVAGLPGGPAPIASFRLGTTPGVSYTWDGDSLVNAQHPPVHLEPGRCYWLAISRQQGGSPTCNVLWHWMLTTSSSPAADRVFATRDVSGPTPGVWLPLTVSVAGDDALSNFVYLLSGGPVVPAVCELSDCNGNGVPDHQEIAANPALDCFSRAIPGQHGGAPDGFLDACQCVANWDLSPAVDSRDIAAYITTWLAAVADGSAAADIDCSGSTTSTDISTFIARWLAAVSSTVPYDGCP